MIGVLGGMSPVATRHYYEMLNNAVHQERGGYSFPELLVSSVNFADVVDFVTRGDEEGLAALLLERLQGLERAGAQWTMMAANTPHMVADRIIPQLSRPFLHIAEPAARAIEQAGLRRVGLLGTRPITETSFLGTALRRFTSIETIVPSREVRAELHQLIVDELCLGKLTDTARRRVQQMIVELRGRGADGVVLACTELELLLPQASAQDTPLFPTMRLHVEAAAEIYLGRQSIGETHE